jgi:hypothetical protein
MKFLLEERPQVFQRIMHAPAIGAGKESSRRLVSMAAEVTSVQLLYISDGKRLLCGRFVVARVTSAYSSYTRSKNQAGGKGGCWIRHLNPTAQPLRSRPLPPSGLHSDRSGIFEHRDPRKAESTVGRSFLHLHKRAADSSLYF